MGAHDKRKVYAARQKGGSAAPLPVSFAEGSEEAGISLLRQLLNSSSSQSVQLVEDSSRARYLIHAREGSYWLTSLQDERPLFRRLQGYDTNSAKAFISRLEKVARWVQLQELNHSGSQALSGAVQLQLFRGQMPGNLQNDAPMENVDWWAPGTYTHVRPDGTLANPTFQFCIKNKGQQTLYATVIYMGIDFSADNVLMSMERLEAGQEAWCRYMKDGHPNRSIPIKLHEVYHQWGLTEATSYLKVIVSTERFDSDAFNQQGLPLEGYQAGHRQIDIPPKAPTVDWMARTIRLNIHRPLPAQPLSQWMPAKFFGHTIAASAEFSAKVALKTLEDCCRELGITPELETDSHQFLQPVELGPWEVKPQLSVLQLQSVKGAESVSGKMPLSITFRDEVCRQFKFGVYGRNAFQFSPLQSRWQGHTLEIQEMPPSEEDGKILLFFFRH